MVLFVYCRWHTEMRGRLVWFLLLLLCVGTGPQVCGFECVSLIILALHACARFLLHMHDNDYLMDWTLDDSTL